MLASLERDRAISEVHTSTYLSFMCSNVHDPSTAGDVSSVHTAISSTGHWSSITWQETTPIITKQKDKNLNKGSKHHTYTNHIAYPACTCSVQLWILYTSLSSLHMSFRANLAILIGAQNSSQCAHTLLGLEVSSLPHLSRHTTMPSMEWPSTPARKWWSLPATTIHGKCGPSLGNTSRCFCEDHCVLYLLVTLLVVNCWWVVMDTVTGCQVLNFIQLLQC